MVDRTVWITALLAGLQAGAQDWPRFRGPGGAGISDATTVPVKWTAQDYNWKVKLPGEGHSSPAVCGERIYLTCADPATATRMVLCLHASDGRTLWQRDFPSKKYRHNAQNSFATASPAADADGVVVTWTTPEEVTLLALDRDGKDLWRRNLGPFVALHGSGSSPVILGDLAILANEQGDFQTMNRPAQAPKSCIVAVDRKTGETRWQIPRRTTWAVYATPCVRQDEDGRTELVFASMSHGFTAVEPASGKIVWETGDLLKECVCSPVVADGLVIAGDSYFMQGGHFVAVRAPSRKQGTKPAVAWEIPKPVPRVSTPVVWNGRLFLWSEEGAVACHSVATGQMIWRERMQGAFHGSPVCVGGRLYCISRSGDVVVLAASDKLELLARVPLGEASSATPAIANGVMYLRTRSQLFSLGGRKP
jgi:outer membrane protein assembly factor BamB